LRVETDPHQFVFAGFGEGTPQQDSAEWRRIAEIWARGRILLSRLFSHTKKLFSSFFIIFLHILDFVPVPCYNITSPKAKRNAARVRTTIGKGGMLWRAFSIRPSSLYPTSPRKSRGSRAFSEKFLIF